MLHIQKKHFIFLSFIASCSALRNANNVIEDQARTIKNNSTVTAIVNCDNETAYLRAIVDDDQEKAKKIEQDDPELVDRIRANPDKYCTDSLRNEIFKMSQEGDSGVSDRLFKIMYPSYKEDKIFSPKNIESTDKPNFSSKFLKSLLILRVRSYLKKKRLNITEVLTTILPDFIFDFMTNETSDHSESYALAILFKEIDCYYEKTNFTTNLLSNSCIKKMMQKNIDDQTNDDRSGLLSTLWSSIKNDLKIHEIKKGSTQPRVSLLSRIKFKILEILMARKHLSLLKTLWNQIYPNVNKYPEYNAAAICSFLSSATNDNDSYYFDTVFNSIKSYLQKHSSLYVHDILNVLEKTVNNNNLDKSKELIKLIKDHLNNNRDDNKYQYKLNELFLLAESKENKDIIDLLKPFFICRILPEKYEKEECAICLELLGSTEGRGNRKQILVLTCKHHFDNQCLMTWKQDNATCPMCRQDIKIAEYYVTRPLQ